MLDENTIYRRKKELELLIIQHGETILTGGFATMEDYKLACGTRNGLTLALSVMNGEYDASSSENTKPDTGTNYSR